MYALFLALWSSLALAVESPVRVEVADAIASPGAEVPIAVRLSIPAGHHVYADQLAVDVIDAASLTIGAPVEPPGKLQSDPANPARQREVYEGELVVELPARVPADASGAYVVKLLVTHQACREGLCYPDRADRLDARVNVAGVAPIPGVAAAQAQEPAEELAVTFTGQPGPPGTATIHVDLHGEWHLNKMFMSTTLVEPQGYTLGEMQLPAGEKTGSEADGTAREDFVHDFDIVVPVTGPEGAVTLTLDVGYQACKGVAICRMPTSEQVKVPVVLGAATGAPVGASSS
ncbi:MAG: protein-disulfide reductase DsbD N-terminal domain-containing protein, partial [Deltaproteobacteria bacterium]|nr:protein-disulfide reductase DsbD N-terminal domain-containing protein [Deltaproteobacteria bacterium]